MKLSERIDRFERRWSKQELGEEQQGFRKGKVVTDE